MDDEILEAEGTADVLEEVLQSVTAQALRMGRVEDGVTELRTQTQQMHTEQAQLQQQLKMLLDKGPAGSAGANDGKIDHQVVERLDEVDAAAKRSARRATWTLFLAGLQMILMAGLLAQSYMKLEQMEAMQKEETARAEAPPPAAPAPAQPIVGQPAPALVPLETVGSQNAPAAEAAPPPRAAAKHKKSHKR